jgi:hypothetical protein
MRKALSASVALVMTLGLLLGGCSPSGSAQAPSGPPDRVLDEFKTPDNGNSTIYLFCRNGDYYVYMNGYKSGNITQYPNDERCK